MKQIRSVNQFKVGKTYKISQKGGSYLGEYIYVQPEGMPNDICMFFDRVDGKNAGHTFFKNEFGEFYLYNEV